MQRGRTSYMLNMLYAVSLNVPQPRGLSPIAAIPQTVSTPLITFLMQIQDSNTVSVCVDILVDFDKYRFSSKSKYNLMMIRAGLSCKYFKMMGWFLTTLS